MLNISGYDKYSYLFELFCEISAIPRGSGNTDGIVEYLVNFAKARGLEYQRDAKNNVIIRKPATAGYEDAPAVILQGHSDIVAEKTNDCKIDMSREGLDLYVDGDFIKARGTTLGADDGVAMVYALAVLDGKCEAHPAIEALITSDEEIGLLGASALDGSQIRGRLLVNLDSDGEGIFTVGCAGGMEVTVSLTAGGEKYSGGAMRLAVSGLTGGHSGVDIDRGRENATKLMASILAKLGDIQIVSLSGGTKDNAIPRDAECVFVAKEIGSEVYEAIERIKSECIDREPNISIELCPIETEGVIRSVSDSAKIVSLLAEFPNGIVKMSEELEGQVETSLNLGITRLNDGGLALSFYVRSSRGGAAESVAKSIDEVATLHGAQSRINSSYPAWEYKPDSPLRERMVALYREKYGKDAVVNTIHAGLECGIIASKIDGLDCISMGPDNYDLHTPDERLSISSFVSVWEFICDFLRQK